MPGTVNGTVGDNKMAIVNSLANQDVEISLLDLNPKTRYTLHEKPVEPLSPVEPPKAEERAQVIIDNVYEIIITRICTNDRIFFYFSFFVFLCNFSKL